MTTPDWIMILCGVAFPLSLVVVLVNRLVLGRGIGARAIQFIGASALIPGIVILALINKLDGTTAALIGAFAGYLFSNIAKFDQRD